MKPSRPDLQFNIFLVKDYYEFFPAEGCKWELLTDGAIEIMCSLEERKWVKKGISQNEFEKNLEITQIFAKLSSSNNNEVGLLFSAQNSSLNDFLLIDSIIKTSNKNLPRRELVIDLAGQSKKFDVIVDFNGPNNTTHLQPSAGKNS